MSAVTYHLEHEFETTQDEKDRAACAGAPAELEGLLEASGKAAACPTSQDQIDKTHRQLSRTMWNREAVLQVMEGRTGLPPIGFWVQFGKPGGPQSIACDDSNTAYIILDRPLPLEPKWALPSGSENVRSQVFLTWTSKMDCPSWSIPAGHPDVNGTCQAAIQSVVDERKLLPIARRIADSEGSVQIADVVCQHCYATSGNYDRGSQAWIQQLRYVWTKEAMRIKTQGGKSTLFIDTMVTVIDRANYMMHGAPNRSKELKDGRIMPNPMPAEPKKRRYFRIHDSGDYFSRSYLAQWKEIANVLDDITFWSPTRIWATKWGVDAVNEINAEPRNLIIRPSSFHVNRYPPRIEGPGWAGASTVIHAAQNRGMRSSREKYARFKGERAAPTIDGDDRFTVECDAYAAKSDRTCRNAVDAVASEREGRQVVGCRICWDEPHEIVNYPMH